MRNTAGTQPNVDVAIHPRARERADLVPPLTAEQMVLLKAVFSHTSGGGG
jgi:hypothetical protein